MKVSCCHESLSVCVAGKWDKLRCYVKTLKEEKEEKRRNGVESHLVGRF